MLSMLNNKTRFSRIRTILFILGFTVTGLLVKAQDAGEIQVYGSATTPKYTTIIELHSNYTFTGPKKIKTITLFYKP